MWSAGEASRRLARRHRGGRLLSDHPDDWPATWPTMGGQIAYTDKTTLPTFTFMKLIQDGFQLLTYFWILGRVTSDSPPPRYNTITVCVIHTVKGGVVY